MTSVQPDVQRRFVGRIPPKFKSKAGAQDLMMRLKFGEPTLTIIDARDRQAYHKERIVGAIPVPTEQLPQLIKPILELERRIYIYGSTDEETASAAQKLRQAGFFKVVELQGGLKAWKAIGGPVEGTAADDL